MTLLLEQERDTRQRPERTTSWRPFRRLRALWRSDPDHAGPQPCYDPYLLLEDARAVIAQGWVQNRLFARRGAPMSLRELVFSAKPASLDDVTAACLVGAVIHAARRRGSTDDLIKAGPALDFLWDAWQESRGLGGPGVAGRAAPRELRAIRARDLMQWNDQPGRTREQVLDLLDLAATRAIMAAVSHGGAVDVPGQTAAVCAGTVSAPASVA
jgi:hypothetical protein